MAFPTLHWCSTATFLVWKLLAHTFAASWSSFAHSHLFGRSTRQPPSRCFIWFLPITKFLKEKQWFSMLGAPSQSRWTRLHQIVHMEQFGQQHWDVHRATYAPLMSPSSRAAADDFFWLKSGVLFDLNFSLLLLCTSQISHLNNM